MLPLRVPYSTAIQYVLITEHVPMISTFIPPGEFIGNHILDFVKHCPQDFFQLHDSLSYYGVTVSQNLHNGFDFKVIYHENLPQELPILNATKRIKLFFINTKIPNHESIYGQLNNHNSLVNFFLLFNRTSLPEFRLENEIHSPEHFIQTLIERQKAITTFLGSSLTEITPSVEVHYKDFNIGQYFVPAKSNMYLIDRIIGNFGDEVADRTETIENSEDDEVMEVSSQAIDNLYSWERQEIFIDQIRKIDSFREKCIEIGLLKPVASTDCEYAPLIIILPFHNPDVKSNLPALNTLLQTEQSSNYIFTGLADDGDDDAEKRFEESATFNIDRLRYLDSIGFLYAAFQFSPYIRLPIKGKSLYRELSFFRSKNFDRISSPNARRKINESISKLGKRLKENLICPRLEDLITKRNGQIIAITDLPIEWINIKGVPLAFSHDICRMPETSLHGLMANHTLNSTFEFVIQTDILEKTLVIFGNTESEFKRWHDLVQKEAINLSFNIEICLTIQSVADAVHKHKPSLLIFDCHGGYNHTNKSTYLRFGEEIMDGNTVVKKGIQAPLVFISACGTAPTYGAFNTIANAFFEVGSLAVTTTYLPVTVAGGSLLYLRILINLSNAARKPFHRNWLSFISHMMRTSAIHDGFLKAFKKAKQPQKDIGGDHLASVVEVLRFSERRKLFHQLDGRIKKVTKADGNYFSSVVPEYLFYSNLGRQDLIEFESWKVAFKKKMNAD